MVRGGTEPAPTLSFTQANAVCRELVPVGEPIFRYMDELQESGFSAFVPYHRFVESFCCEREREKHRLCLIEQAKSTLGQPWPWRFNEEDWLKVYLSEYLRQLEEEQTKLNGVSTDELSSKYPPGEAFWRMQIDP